MCRFRHVLLFSILGSLALYGMIAPRPHPVLPAAHAAAPEKVDALIRQLDNKEENVRLSAVIALGELGREARAATPALIDVLKTGTEELRLNTALTLGRIGEDAVAPVARLLNDKDSGLRFYAVWTLGLIGPDARGTTSAVVAALKDKVDDVRRKAAFALGRIDPKVEAAAPGLIEALADPNLGVRLEAAEAVKRFDARAVPFLAQAIRTQASLREPAVAVLNQIAADAEIMVGAFLPLLREKEAAVQKVAGDVLIRQGKAAIPQLLALLEDKDQRVRLEGLRLLTNIPPDSALMLPRLKRLVAAKVSSVRESALVLLARLGPEGVPHLVGALTDRNAGVRWTAAFSLGEMGQAARNAVPALIRAAEDADPDVREAARAAVRKIRGKD
jgi:HEAT repeat protein